MLCSGTILFISVITKYLSLSPLSLFIRFKPFLSFRSICPTIFWQLRGDIDIYTHNKLTTKWTWPLIFLSPWPAHSLILANGSIPSVSQPWKAWAPSLTFLPSSSGPVYSLSFYSFHLLNTSIICFGFFVCLFVCLHINCHLVNLATLIACIINPSSPWTGLSVLILPSLTHSVLYTFVRMIFMIVIMAFSYLNTLNYMVFSSSISLLNLYMWYFLFCEPHHPPFFYQANSYLSLRLQMKTSLFQGSHHCLQVWINVALMYA